MNYYMPVQLVFGSDSLKKSASRFAQFGKKALLVTGKTSAVKSGVLDDLLALLKENNISYSMFDEVTENPDFLIVEKGTALCRKDKCDFVIGIGGGSPIDAAKAIAVMTGSDLKVEELYQSEKIRKALPIVSIPTTSGTGSEATQYSVLTDPVSLRKAGFASDLAFPRLSILDPRYTRTLSFRVTRDTAIDALSHLLEGIYSNRTNILNYPLIFEGIRLILNNLKPCLNEPENLFHRDKLMLASLYGGITIAQTGTTLQHALGYPLTTKFGISHGLANGLVMRDVMELFFPHRNDTMNNLFAFLGLSQNDFFEWLESLKMSSGVKLDDEFINKESENIFMSGNMKNNPADVDQKSIVNIYRNIKQEII